MGTLPKQIHLALIAVAGCMIAGCAAADSLLTAALTPPVLSESFEAPVTQNFTTYNAGQSFTTSTNTWKVTASGIDIVNASKPRMDVAVFDGVQAVDMAGSPGAGAIETTFATTSGQKYTLTFHYARNNLIGSNPARARVEVVGSAPLLQAEVIHDTAGGTYKTYRRYAGIFMADGPQATLRFTSLTAGSYGITLDGISIRAVPAPTAAQPAQ